METPGNDYFDPDWESLLRLLEIDCRVLSYDQFCDPPAGALWPDAEVDWYSSLGRSTPNRMWRKRTADGRIIDIWGRVFGVQENPYGAYEELVEYALRDADSISDLKAHSWPDPDWWDFSEVADLITLLEAEHQYHIRYRIGSVFEVAWQLRGMDTFLLDMAVDPKIPAYIMERLTDVYVEITKRFLEAAGDRVEMVYFYDDVATQESLLISEDMWEALIKPHHARIIEHSKTLGKKVMYHCDGAIYPLIPRLIEMGVDVLNPVQADAKGMDPSKLKAEFGDRISFHGGIDIVETLPKGLPGDVQAEVRRRADQLGRSGGYIMASSHHIQADTPLKNILAMYDLSIR